MTATEIEFSETTVPKDETPPTVSPTGDFDPQYPGSTPEAPYGFKPDGTPYKRRPKGTGGGTSRPSSPGRMPASEQSARMAAGLLARMNMLVSFGLQAAGLPMTAAELNDANEQFEQMAYEALLTDPALCRKVLSAGATSGKAGLVMAYGMLTVSILPAAKSEIATARAARLAAREDNDYAD